MKSKSSPVESSLVVVRVTPKTKWIFLTLTDSDGISGFGEATLNGREVDVLAAARQRLSAPSSAPAVDLPDSAVMSALDQAVHDLRARRIGTPIWKLFGETARARIPVYANINRRTVERTPDGFAESASSALAAGHDAFKLAPFDGVTKDAVASGSGRIGLEHGFACVAEVRRIVGSAARLMIDCHWRFDVALAEEAIDRAAELGLYWVECPLPEVPENLPALRRLRHRANAKGVLLAGCEEAIGAAGFSPYLDAGAYDVLMPDVKYVGGFAEWLRLIELASRTGVALSPHNPSGPICHAMSLQISTVLPAFDRLELQFDESPLFSELMSTPFPSIHSGSTPLPAGPGCGMAFDTEVLATHVERSASFPIALM